AAARRIREDGLSGFGVAEIMKQAGLTPGGFYGHFSSHQTLIGEAMERAFGDRPFAASVGRRTAKTFLRRNLSPAHRDEPGTGCAVSALAGDVRHADPESREILTRHLRRRFQTLTDAIGGDEDAWQRSLCAISTMVGALTLARAVDDTKLADEILAASREMLCAYIDE